MEIARAQGFRLDDIAPAAKAIPWPQRAASSIRAGVGR